MAKKTKAIFSFQVFRASTTNDYRWRLVIHQSVIIFESIDGWPNKLAAGEAARLARRAINNAVIVQTDD